MEEEYPSISIDKLQKSPYTVYMDEDIALLNDLNELPRDHDGIKADIGIIVACVEGRMSINLNAERIILQANDVLLCAPHTVLNDCMVSPDFKVKIIGLRSHVLLDTMHMGNDLWKKAFHIKENPVIHVGKERVELFRAYFRLLNLRTQTGMHEYEKDIMISLIRALMYELLSEVGTSANYPGGEMTQQRDVLFKRFMLLLSSTYVKPRTVAWYAEKLFVTPKHLSTTCKAVSGKTAFNWINEYVMTDIRRMLKNSDKSIKEVADSLGFPNISFFGKYVKSHTGLNPTDYRRQLRESKQA